MKIVVIGGGSSYTPELFDGLIKKRKTLDIEEIVLVDIPIGKKKLEINFELVKRMFERVNWAVKINITMDLEHALANADYIITQLRVGGLEKRALDEEIPLKYGLIGQETTGAGGFSKALRTIPVMMDICKKIETLSKENAWLINFTNPAGMITEAIKKYTNVNVIGVCNVPYNMKVNIAKSMDVPTETVRVTFAGLNHLVYGKKVYIDGMDKTKDVIEALINGASNTMNNIPDLDYPESLLRSLDMIPCPYHKYYYLKEEMLKEELDQYHKNGHTRAIDVMAIEKELFDIYEDKSLNKKPKALEKRGGAYYSEVAISLIDAIENDKQEIHTVNIPNNGAIKGLSDDAVVEINALIGKQGAAPLIVGNLSKIAMGLIKQVKNYETLTIESVIEQDRLKAIQALANHPLVNSFKVASDLFDEIIKANENYVTKFY